VTSGQCRNPSDQQRIQRIKRARLGAMLVTLLAYK
jgi:hypothetical protein